MMARLRTRIAASAGAFGRAFANPDIRRLQLANAGSLVGTWSYSIALFVYAFDIGGAAAVGLVALTRYVPSAVASPFTSLLGDRFSRVRVMIVSDLVRVGTMVGAAVTIALDGPPAIVFVLAAVTSVTATAFRPAKSAVLPSLARTPEELTASNVASATIESVGVFAGPALGGLLLAVTAPEVVFLVNAATFLWSAYLVARMRGGRTAPPGKRERGARAIVRDLAAGAGVVAREPALRLVVLLTGAQTLVFGAMTVLIVVLALELLEIGEAGVGLLNSALGIGGLLGSVAAVLLIGRARLGPAFAVGITLWGLPLVALGLWQTTLFALLLFGLVGVANTIVDVAGHTLLQRTAPEAVLARVFGVLEGLIYLGIALGGILAPVLIALLGAEWAFVAVGAFLPLLALLSWRALSGIGTDVAPGRPLDLLRALPMFTPLPLPTLERLAGALEPVSLPRERTLFSQGDHGDRFYVVAAGEVDVAIDGRHQATMQAGDCFGEIALLRDMPRTATVTARSDAELYALERDEFLAAVTGHPESTEAAEAMVGERLSTLGAAGT
jgi:MFS family permease